MTATPGTEDELAEFAAELKLLAEAVLERVEPVLRRAAASGAPEWESCSWCPVCAAAALVRGERHDVLAAVADHGTAIVTVLREALAGVPVDPVMPPPEDPETGEPHDRSHPAPAGHPRAGRRGGPRNAAAAGAAADPAAADQEDAEPGPDGSDAGGPGADPPGKRRGRRRPGYVDIPITLRR